MTSWTPGPAPPRGPDQPTADGMPSESARAYSDEPNGAAPRGPAGPTDESSGPRSRAAGFWRSVRRLPGRTPLRIKLITAVLALVAIALAVISFAGVSFLGGYLIKTYDQSLENGSTETRAVHEVQQYQSTGQALPGFGYSVYWLSANGSLQRVVEPVTPYGAIGPAQQQTTAAGPALRGALAWLAANPEQPTTVRASSGHSHWRVIAYQEPELGNGLMIVGLDVSGVYQTTRQLTYIDGIVSVVVIVVLAIIGITVVRANLRPLDEIEETAEQIAAGHLDRRVPDRDPRTEVGSLGRSINAMLAQLEAGYRARQQSEAAARRSEERMRRFIADASHELRTPLTAIRGFAEYYRQRGGVSRPANAAPATGQAGAAGEADLTPDDLDRIMHRVEDEAARMGVLVEDLLLLARLDQQRPMDRQPVDMLTLAADAVQDTRMIAPNRSVNLHIEPGGPYLVVGDEVRLRQVIGNLMSNALRHTPDGTPVDVRVAPGMLDPASAPQPRSQGAPKAPVPAVVLEVADQGPGLTPEQAGRVFERFYRADQARARKSGGAGLGLAIVQALVTAHGGTASVRSAPDQGATFRVTLPLAPDALAGNPPEDDIDDIDVGGGS